MNGKSQTKTGIGFIVLMSIVMLTSPSFGYDVYLRAEEVIVTMPDDVNIPMWGFALDTDANFIGTMLATVPGPTITVPVGDSNLTIYVKNNLSVPISIVIPGLVATMDPNYFTDGEGRQRVSSFTTETAAGAIGTYSWTSLRAGTFMYHSGRHPAVQVQMGLYGCMKKDESEGVAYTGVSYDNEIIVFYSEIDPNLHDAVDTGNYGPGKSMTAQLTMIPSIF